MGLNSTATGESGNIEVAVYGKNPTANSDNFNVNFALAPPYTDENGTPTVTTVNATVLGVAPVNFLGFNVAKEDAVAMLSWGTASETNTNRFEVQHGLDGKTWRSIGEVQALGESSSNLWYNFLDANPVNGTNFNRIKAIDNDGTFDYYYIRTLDFEIENIAKFYPNPVAETLKLMGENLSNVSSVTLLNSSGKALVETAKFDENGIDVKQLPAGFYTVRLLRNNGSIDSFKVVKQ